jgi:hypothetical protein
MSHFGALPTNLVLRSFVPQGICICCVTNCLASTMTDKITQTSRTLALPRGVTAAGVGQFRGMRTLQTSPVMANTTVRVPNTGASIQGFAPSRTFA